MTITRKSSARFLITVLAGVSLLVAPAVAPASASQRHTPADHRIVHQDARRDVLHFDIDGDTGRPAPRDRATDVTTTVVDHRADRLDIHVQARRLSRSGYRLVVGEILAPHGKRFTLVVDYSRTPIDARVSLERFASGRDVRCPGATWSISMRADTVIASVPTSCLGDPGWVRVGLALSAAPHDLNTSWADDARVPGRIGDRHLRLGPRQHRA